MEIIDILGWIIVTIICFLIAPLMTIGVILIGAKSLGIFGDILGTIFLIGGLFRMFNKILKG